MEISPRSLRIGNYLSEGRVIEIGENYFRIESKAMSTFHSNCIDITPIPLTAKWLLKFGFKLVGSQTYEKTCGDDFTIKVEDDQHCGTALFLEGSGAIPIDFLHQLQNIVHALTGEELTIQEKEIEPPMIGMSY